MFYCLPVPCSFTEGLRSMCLVPEMEIARYTTTARSAWDEVLQNDIKIQVAKMCLD